MTTPVGEACAACHGMNAEFSVNRCTPGSVRTSATARFSDNRDMRLRVLYALFGEFLALATGVHITY
jgi:hypothetical protein